MANGKTANMQHCIGRYLIAKEHRAADGTIKNFRELEIEVSAVVQGGLYFGK